jgi:hypothetical protein
VALSDFVPGEITEKDKMFTAYDFLMDREPWLVEIFLDAKEACAEMTIKAGEVAQRIGAVSGVQLCRLDGFRGLYATYPAYVWEQVR